MFSVQSRLLCSINTNKLTVLNAHDPNNLEAFASAYPSEFSTLDWETYIPQSGDLSIPGPSTLSTSNTLNMGQMEFNTTYQMGSGRNTRNMQHIPPPLVSAGRRRGSTNLPLSPVSPGFPPNATHGSQGSIDSASALGPMSTAVRVPVRKKRGGPRRTR
jgi:hypothetical protein